MQTRLNIMYPIYYSYVISSYFFTSKRKLPPTLATTPPPLATLAKSTITSSSSTSRSTLLHLDMNLIVENVLEERSNDDNMSINNIKTFEQ
ncbi:unnamed protein product [Rhizophagus irregularis]|nr:unnamed protein product [Rhizophagus irregularis]